MEELTVTEIDEIVIIEKMQAMCEESCSPDQFEEWEKLKAHLMVTRKNLRAAQPSAQPTVDQPCKKHNMEFCSECFPVVVVDFNRG